MREREQRLQDAMDALAELRDPAAAERRAERIEDERRRIVEQHEGHRR